MWSTLAFAQEMGEAAAQQQDVPNPFMQTLPFLIIFIGIMYFLMIRPNQKREKERREMLASLDKGDEVITTGGIYGTIVGLSDATVVLRVSEDPLVKLEFARGAVSKVTSKKDD